MDRQLVSFIADSAFRIPRSAFEFRFLDQDVSVGSANTERADARQSRRLRPLPRRQRVANFKRTVLKIDLRIRFLIMKGRRNLFVVQRHGCLDQTCDTRCCDGVADVRFDTTDRAELFLVSLGFKHRPQRRDFNWISDRCRGTMSFDIPDIFWIDARHRVSHRDRVRLASNAWCTEACFIAAIVVDPKAANDRVNSIVIGNRILKPTHHHHARAVAE